MMKNRQHTQSRSDGETTIVSLDIGTHTIKALMAVVEPDAELTYVSGGEFPSEGIREGIVSVPERARAALIAALDELEVASETRIMTAYVSVGGPLVHSQPARGQMNVARPGQEISRHEVGQVIAQALQQITPDERSEQLHVIPRGYTIDGVSGIPNPEGMVGFELAVDACVVTAPLVVTQNLAHLLMTAGAEPDDLIAGPLAAGESVRAQCESGLPHVVVNIGAQTTGVAVYADGAIWQCDCLPIGGDFITQQMARKLRLSIEDAETLKRRYATCLPSAVADGDLIEMEPINGTEELVPASVLTECAALGAQQLTAALLAQLQKTRRLGLRPAALLLTGGGAELGGLDAQLAGALHIPVMVARPAGLNGAPPMLTRPAFATATGLLLLGAHQRRRRSSTAHGRSASVFDALRRRLYVAFGAGADHAARGRGKGR